MSDMIGDPEDCFSGVAPHIFTIPSRTPVDLIVLVKFWNI